MGIADGKYILLTTYRKDGTPVPAPVWLVELPNDGEELVVGFWTSSGSGKAKRLAHTSRVTVQACDVRGNVDDGTEPIEGTAELVTGPALDEIRPLIKAKYGIMTSISKWLGSIGGIIKRNRIPYGDRGVVITLPAGS